MQHFILGTSFATDFTSSDEVDFDDFAGEVFCLLYILHGNLTIDDETSTLDLFLLLEVPMGLGAESVSSALISSIRGILLSHEEISFQLMGSTDACSNISVHRVSDADYEELVASMHGEHDRDNDD